MSWSRILARYALAIALREWVRCRRVKPEVRLGTTAIAGAVLSPFVVFGWPVARLYWLITGRRLPGALGWLYPPPRIFVNPIPPGAKPPDLRTLLERPEYNWQPGPGDIPVWLNRWSQLAQILAWEIPPKDLAKVTREQKTDV